MEKLEIKNLEIEFNGIVKIIPISDDFAKEIRVWNEFASMCLETMFEGMPKQSDDNNNVFVLVSQEAAKALGYKRGSFPVAEMQADKLITLPTHQFVNDDQIDFMIENISKFYK